MVTAGNWLYFSSQDPMDVNVGTSLCSGSAFLARCLMSIELHCLSPFLSISHATAASQVCSDVGEGGLGALAHAGGVGGRGGSWRPGKSWLPGEGL